MGCCLLAGRGGRAYGCRGFVLVPGVRRTAIALVWSLRLRGRSWLHVTSTTFLFLFFKYLVHNRSCNHDPTKFAAGPGIGGEPLGESARTDMCDVGPCEFLRGFPGILGPVMMSGSMVEIGAYILS